jgi:lysyl-tRNA synthetase class 2
MVTPNNSSSLSTEEAVRQKKSIDFQKATNLRPWTTVYPQNISRISLLHEVFSFTEDVEAHTKEYSIAGRIKEIREHGKSLFFVLCDESGKIQCYIKKNDEDGSFDYFKKYLDSGDIISASGRLFLTKTKERTLFVSKISLLSKCLRSIPSSYTGLEDIETRYRKRYLDVMISDSMKSIFQKRSMLVSAIRSLLDEEGYLEVETPMLHTIAGGALAKPFITKHNALSIDLFLRIAPELFLKKLIVGGFERVYEINKNFRNEGVSPRHNPEFTMLEFYTAYKDYVWAMDFVENMIQKLVSLVSNSLEVVWQTNTISFSRKFDRLTPLEAVLKYTDFTSKELAPETINTLLPVEMNSVGQEEKIFFLFEKYVESKLIQPTFIIDFPLSLSPLAKASSQNPQVASRFELFIGGMEISNGYNELNDPDDQEKRFLQQVQNKTAGDDEAMPYDKGFIEALEYGMPPTAGVGIGVDRLCMLLLEVKSIKDIILFPTMKPL